jgi:hypothetical protein
LKKHKTTGTTYLNNTTDFTPNKVDVDKALLEGETKEESEEEKKRANEAKEEAKRVAILAKEDAKRSGAPSTSQGDQHSAG